MLLRIAISQFRPSKGNLEETLSRIEEVLARVKAMDTAPDVVVFPETALTGYFLEGGVREHAVGAHALLDQLAERYARAPGPDRPVDIVIGFFEEFEHRIYNSSLYAELGSEPRLVHVHRKVFLPTYGVFQEERFVEAGPAIRAFDTRWGRTAMLICEDMFHSVSPMLAALDGALALIVCSASPARGVEPGKGRPGNVERWERLARAAAEEHGVAVVVSQLLGFEGGKGFAGGSVACGPRGDVLWRGPLWEEALELVELDLGEITAARVDLPMLSDLEQALPRLLESRRTGAEPDDCPDSDRGAADSTLRAPDRAVATGRALNPELLAIDEELVEQWLVRFLREEMVERRGFRNAVVGLSGGVDSAVTAALCARALGPENVHAFLMPYRTSSPESAEHAGLVAEQLGIHSRTIDITAAADGYLAEHEPEADGTRRGNVMARQRMIVLFDQAAKLSALPVGTGNKSERLLGYFTWHADDSPPINPIGDLFKSQVWALARHLGLPAEVVEKPATADLVSGQTDEADLGVSYAVADLILYHLVTGRTAEWIVAAGFDATAVANVQRRLDGTHWKRNLPTVAMLSATTIGEWYLRPVDY